MNKEQLNILTLFFTHKRSNYVESILTFDID